jgi:Tfp pilus assembly protein PilX
MLSDNESKELYWEGFELNHKEKHMSKILRNQSGAALVIALVMMIVLTLIGLASMMTSTFELRLSGNTRGSVSAFYTADGGSQAARATDVWGNFALSTVAAISPSSLPHSLQGQPIDGKQTKTIQLSGSVAFNIPPTVAIYHTTQRGRPRGAGESAVGESYDYEYYITDTLGFDQQSSSWSNPSKVEIVEKIALVVPPKEGGN